MTLLIKLLAAGLLHVAFYASYPETGPFGNYYLAISLLLWGVFTIFLNTSAKLVRFISGAAGTIVSVAAFALMALSLAATMPQQDKTSVLEKIQGGKYPDRETVNAGMRRFGINLDREVASGVKNLDREAAKAIEKIKRD